MRSSNAARAVAILPVPPVEIREVELVDRVDHEVHQVILGQPLHHVEWQQQLLVTVARDEVFWALCTSANGLTPVCRTRRRITSLSRRVCATCSVLLYSVKVGSRVPWDEPASSAHSRRHRLTQQQRS